MSDKNLEKYVKLIRNFKPILFYTIPSVAITLAEFMRRNHIAPFASLRWVFCPSENLYESHLKFGVPSALSENLLSVNSEDEVDLVFLLSILKTK